MPESASDAPLARQLGKRLRLARLRQHKQQTVVAGLAGITTDYLYQIERGLKLPSLTVLMEMARVLDMPLSTLLGETPADSPPNRTSASVSGWGSPLMRWLGILAAGDLALQVPAA